MPVIEAVSGAVSSTLIAIVTHDITTSTHAPRSTHAMLPAVDVLQVGGLVSTAMVYPFEVARTRVCASAAKRTAATGHAEDSDDEEESERYSSVADALVKIVRYEGVAGLYMGLIPSAAKSTLSNFIFYFWYSTFKGAFQRARGVVEARGGSGAGAAFMAKLVELLHGMAAGACTGLMIMPLDMVVTRVQTRGKGKGKGKGSASGSGDGGSDGGGNATLSVIKSIYEEGGGGLRNFFASIEPTLALTTNPGINMLAQESMRAGRDKVRTRRVESVLLPSIATTITVPPEPTPQTRPLLIE